MAAVLDVAVSLFGTSGSGGRRSSGSSNGRPEAGGVGKSDAGKNDEGLVTFTVDVHTGGCTTLGIGVKELGGGAVVVEVQNSARAVSVLLFLSCVYFVCLFVF